MDIVESREGAVTIVKPMGPLALGDADEFRRRVEDVRLRSLGRFVIDCSAVAYADSQGLEALLSSTESLSDAGQSLRLCCVNDTLREVFELTEIGGLFEYYQDVNTGVRSFL